MSIPNTTKTRVDYFRLLFGTKDARHEEFDRFDLRLQELSPIEVWKVALVIVAIAAAIAVLVL